METFGVRFNAAAGLRRKGSVRASRQLGVDGATSARLRRGRPLATAIDASLSRTSAGAPFTYLAALALALGFSTPAEAGSILVVNTTADPNLDGGKLSLRQAIALANMTDNNTVLFDASLVGSTITLTQGELALNRPMEIVGNGVGKTTISGNDASGIFSASGCSAAIDIKEMRLTHGKGTFGGAIATENCDLNLTDVEVSASQATIRGGGVYAFDSTVSILTSSITGNSARVGGGVSGYQSLIQINRSTIGGNQATYRGGGVYLVHGSDGQFYSSTISGNFIPLMTGPYYEPVGGGGALIRASRFSAINLTVAYNYSFASGGGIRFYDAYAANNAIFTSSTISTNSTCCYDAGNGIVSTGATVYLFSSIVANNFNRGGNDDLAGSFHILGTLVRSVGGSASVVSESGSKLGVDPELGVLGANGGPTMTMLPAAGSPVIDAANDCSTEITPFDERGVTRCVNGHVDMGAVERQIPEVIIFRNGFDPGG